MVLGNGETVSVGVVMGECVAVDGWDIMLVPQPESNRPKTSRQVYENIHSFPRIQSGSILLVRLQEIIASFGWINIAY